MRSSVPFLRATTPPAQLEIQDAAQYLATNFSAEIAARFLDRLEEELIHLCERWGEGLRPLPNEEATLFYSRPVFVHTFRTGQQRRRRNTTGVWRIFYDAIDADSDGLPDTLRVLTVRHGAARPFSIEDDDET